MKIGHPADTPAVAPVALGRTGPADASAKPGVIAGGAEPSAQGAPSQAAATLLPGGGCGADFDAQKVERIAQAIADGTFNGGPVGIEADRLRAPTAFEGFSLNAARMAAQPSPATPDAVDPLLEGALAEVEVRIASLGEALQARDAVAIDQHASELHRALARAVDRFTAAARTGAVHPALRRRLAGASGQVAAQRESLARATAALDRAIDVLIPRDVPGLHPSPGATERDPLGGCVQA